MREFLKGLDLDSETIDTIMAEHGKLLQGLKEKNTDLETKYNELSSSTDKNDTQIKQLTTENETLKAQNSKLTSDFNNLNNQTKVIEKGVNKQYAKFVASEVSGLVNDDTDFEKAFDDYISKNPQFKEVGTIKKVTTTKPFNGEGNQPKSTNEKMNDILLGTLGFK